MNNINFIYEYLQSEKTLEREAMVAAMVACLSPEEACEAVEPNIRVDHPVQKSLQRKINRDIVKYGFLDCHDELIRRLITNFEYLPYKRKQGCANWLRSLYYNSLPLHQIEIIHFLVNSKYVPVRDQGYKILKDHWMEDYHDLLIRSWHLHHDEKCAILLIEKCDIELVLSELNTLERVLSRSSRIAKLFIKVGATYPLTLERLKQIDSITYSYVLVKLNKVLDYNTALDIFNECKADNRIGLFIWCIGQMGLWSVLKHIASLTDKQLLEIYQSRFDQ